MPLTLTGLPYPVVLAGVVLLLLLRREVTVPLLLGVGVVLELGPVMTSFVLIGRVGARITAEIGTMQITMRDVLSLQKGDVIRLQNVRVNDPMVLKIGNMTKFLCRPGLVGSKVAVQITDQLEEIESEEFEELAAEGEE